MRLVQRCPCVARVAIARTQAKRYQRIAMRSLFTRNEAHDDISRQVMLTKAEAALLRATQLAKSRRGTCSLCGDTGFITGNGSAQRGGVQSKGRMPSEQAVGVVRIA